MAVRRGGFHGKIVSGKVIDIDDLAREKDGKRNRERDANGIYHGRERKRNEQVSLRSRVQPLL